MTVKAFIIHGNKRITQVIQSFKLQYHHYKNIHYLDNSPWNVA